MTRVHNDARNRIKNIALNQPSNKKGKGKRLTSRRSLIDRCLSINTYFKQRNQKISQEYNEQNNENDSIQLESQIPQLFFFVFVNFQILLLVFVFKGFFLPFPSVGFIGLRFWRRVGQIFESIAGQYSDTLLFLDVDVVFSLIIDVVSDR